MKFIVEFEQKEWDYYQQYKKDRESFNKELREELKETYKHEIKALSDLSNHAKLESESWNKRYSELKTRLEKIPMWVQSIWT